MGIVPFARKALFGILALPDVLASLGLALVVTVGVVGVAGASASTAGATPFLIDPPPLVGAPQDVPTEDQYLDFLVALRATHLLLPNAANREGAEAFVEAYQPADRLRVTDLLRDLQGLGLVRSFSLSPDAAAIRVLGTSAVAESLQRDPGVESVMTYSLEAEEELQSQGAASAPAPGRAGARVSAAEAPLATDIATFVQLNGSEVYGYTYMPNTPVTVTLRTGSGAIKARASATSDTYSNHFSVSLTQTVSVSDTVEVYSGGTTTTIPVVSLTATVDPRSDRVTGAAPSGGSLVVYVDRDKPSRFPVRRLVTAGPDGSFVADFAGAADLGGTDYAYVYYEGPDGNRIYLKTNRSGIEVEENSNTVVGYVTPGTRVTVTLSDALGTAKGVVTTSASSDEGSFSASFGGVTVAGGDTLRVGFSGITRTVPIVPLTATLDVKTGMVSGSGPPRSILEAETDGSTIGNSTRWIDDRMVRADENGHFAANSSSSCAYGPCSMGDEGSVGYVSEAGDVIYIRFRATGNLPLFVYKDSNYVYGYMARSGVPITLTLRGPDGRQKSLASATSTGSYYYGQFSAQFTDTIRAGDTVEVTDGPLTNTAPVPALSASLDRSTGIVSGNAPAGFDLRVSYVHLEQPPERAEIQVRSDGTYTTTFSYTAPPAGDLGFVSQVQDDGDQVFVRYEGWPGAVGATVKLNTNYVHGYSTPGATVTATLAGPTGSARLTQTVTADSFGIGRAGGGYSVYFWGTGDSGTIRFGDVVNVTNGNSTARVEAPALSAVGNLDTDTVSGFGPEGGQLELSLRNYYAYEGGYYFRVPSTKVTGDLSGAFVHSFAATNDLIAGDGMDLYYANGEGNIVYATFVAPGAPTTILSNYLEDGAAQVSGTAFPGATVEIKDTTAGTTVGSGSAGTDGRYTISLSTPLVVDHVIVAVAGGQASMAVTVRALVTIYGPAVSLTGMVSLYGTARAASTVQVYERGAAALTAVEADASGEWRATLFLGSGSHVLWATMAGTSKVSLQITVVVNTADPAFGGRGAEAGGLGQHTDLGGAVHIPVVGEAKPITITLEVYNYPCTVTISFKGQQVSFGPITESPKNLTAVFASYERSLGTFDVEARAVSCQSPTEAVTQTVAQVSLVDPSGYVYNSVSGGPLLDASTTAYYSDTAGGAWALWPAASYNEQLNPQMADGDGRYGFMVPPGDYYVSASKRLYRSNQSLTYHVPPPVTTADIPLTPVTATYALIKNFAFSPQVITVVVGTSVTWINQDEAAHTITADQGAWDSGQVGSAYPSYTRVFTATGEYSYHCDLHPQMTGKVTVLAASPTPPVVTAVSPRSVLDGSDTVITVAGTNFVDTPEIRLGGVALADFGWLNSNSLTATVPSGMLPGNYTVTAINPDGGSSSLANALTVASEIFLPFVSKSFGSGW